MERLTIRNSVGVAVYKHPFYCEECGEPFYRLPDYGSGSPTDKLAEYEDLEEQGRLLRLPCKCGDTVYRLTPNIYRGIAKYVVTKLAIRGKKMWFECNDSGVYLSCREIGKTAFFTKAEAEAKLKELRKA